MKLYDHPSEMEPLLPEEDGELKELSLHLLRGSERIREGLHPITRDAVSRLMGSMNSYYSNLIEGHRTTPQDMDAALLKKFSGNQAQRSLQALHLAHVETQAEMELKLCTMNASDVCSADFLLWLHERLYSRLPSEFQTVEDQKGKLQQIEPGKLRQSEVRVGHHLAPSSQKLSEFLGRFEEFYGPKVNALPESLIAAAAAHHRLAWIHPFLDGNGRVTRLFSHAWLIKAGVDGGGLWTISRGFARGQQEYRATLSNADEKRINDLDGRGYLSLRFLKQFCRFFLGTAIDQVEFMHGLLSLDGMQARIMGFAAKKEYAKELPSGSGLVLREIFFRGEIARGEVSRIVGVSARTAQKHIGELLAKRLVVSPSPKGPLRLEFPSEAAGSYFPNLYPAG